MEHVIMVTHNLIQWIRDTIPEDKVAVIGISGGKDSAVAAALCVEALGEDRVVGIIIPNDTQADIKDAYYIVNHLDIPHATVNIGRSVLNIQTEVIDLFEDLQIDRIPRNARSSLIGHIRNDTLHMIAESVNGVVVNPITYTKTVINYYDDALDENTIFPFIDLTNKEVRKIGKYMDIPDFIIEKKSRLDSVAETAEDVAGMPLDKLDDLIRAFTFDNFMESEEDFAELTIKQASQKESTISLISSLSLQNIFTYDPLSYGG